jgi:hypothetical protein
MRLQDLISSQVIFGREGNILSKSNKGVVKGDLRAALERVTLLIYMYIHDHNRGQRDMSCGYSISTVNENRLERDVQHENSPGSATATAS